MCRGNLAERGALAESLTATLAEGSLCAVLQQNRTEGLRGPRHRAKRSHPCWRRMTAAAGVQRFERRRCCRRRRLGRGAIISGSLDQSETRRKPLTGGLSAVRAGRCEIQLMAKTIESSGRARRPRRSAAEWRREVASWRASGLTAAAYAEPRGIHEGTLMGWASRLARCGLDTAVPKGAGRFVPVRVAPARSNELEKEAPRLYAEVVLRGGRCVRLTGELRVDQLRQLLDAVEGGSRC